MIERKFCAYCGLGLIEKTFGERTHRYCQECDVRFVCNGECPRNRFVQTPEGEPGLNYLCSGYKAFFRHVDKPMRLMSDLLHQGRAPADIMKMR